MRQAIELNRPRQSGLPPAAWPNTDKALWTADSSKTPRRRREGPAISAVTRKGLANDYAVSLGWLAAAQALDREALPAARWPRARVEQLIDAMLPSYAIASIHSRVGRLKRALQIMEPAADLRHFDSILRDIAKPQPATRAVVLRVTAADLVRYGVSLMDRAEQRTDWPPKDRAVLLRIGLQIALLARRPLRKGAFVAIKIVRTAAQATQDIDEVQLIKHGDTWRLRVPAMRSKSRRYQSMRFPVHLVPYLDLWLGFYRDILCHDATERTLWINDHGRPQQSLTFYNCLRKMTQLKFRDPIAPQMVRKIVATTMAIHNPKRVHAIMGILGHNGLRVGEKWYNMASSVSAFDALDRSISRSPKSRTAEQKRLFPRNS